MAYKSHYAARAGSKASSGGVKQPTTSYGRVVKTILSLSDPDCKDSSMLNGVFYRIPSLLGNESDDTGIDNTISFAKQGNASIRVIPMEGELVELMPALGVKATAGKVMYWGKIVNVWNHPHHNAVPDIKQQDWSDRLIGGQKEESTISPLQANPGDTLLEGRLGQSIRFGGYKGVQSKNIDSSNDGKPIILISNGQIKTDEGDTPIEEDINKDYNSIQLISDHKSDLLATNTKRDSYDIAPLGSNQYVGNQVIINGGRLYFNAKEDSILLSAKESVGLNARTLNFDATDYACIDAKKIYLGQVARISSNREPVVLGTQLENWLTSLLDTLSSVAIGMSSAAVYLDEKPPIPIVSLNVAGPELDAIVKSLKTQLILFQSKKVFTE